jgi:hypothetical protein
VPCVSVVLIGIGSRVPVLGVVDSGADNTFIPVSLAQHLGIDLGKCRTEVCNTAGGPATQYIWDPGLDAQIQGINVTLHLKTAFSDTPMTLLGREDFFNAFKISFDQRVPRFTLETYESATGVSTRGRI